MTTIISNGYYLLADHRKTTYALKRDALITEDRTMRFDNADKLVIGNKLMMNGQRLLAYALTGNVRKFEFINELNAGNDSFDLYVFLKTCVKLPHSYFQDTKDITTLIGITEDFETIKVGWEFSSKQITYSVSEHEKGDLVTAGSGGAYVDGLLAARPNPNHLSLEELMNVASICDEGTSSSYGVFGARENHKFAHVLGPSKQASILMYNQTIEKLKLPT